MNSQINHKREIQRGNELLGGLHVASRESSTKTLRKLNGLRKVRRPQSDRVRLMVPVIKRSLTYRVFAQTNISYQGVRHPARTFTPPRKLSQSCTPLYLQYLPTLSSCISTDFESGGTALVDHFESERLHKTRKNRQNHDSYVVIRRSVLHDFR